jgi:hypothetical protein
MTVVGVCGVCLSRLEPLKAESPGKCHLTTCSKCKGIYEVVNIHLLKCRPKCHYCRLNQRCSKVKCKVCKLTFNDPTNKFKNIKFICHKCSKFSKSSGVFLQVSISTLLQNQILRQAILSKLSIPDIQYTKPFSKISNKLFYLPAPSFPTNISEIRICGKVAENIEKILNDIESIVREGRRETNECMLCFNDIPKELLIPACGRPDCNAHICRKCISKWYGDSHPGDLINISNLICPFCRRPPTIKTMRQFNERALAMNIQTATFDPNYYYAWCSGMCYKPAPAIRKDCQSDPPNFHGKFVCEECHMKALAETARIKAKKEQEEKLAKEKVEEEQKEERIAQEEAEFEGFIQENHSAFKISPCCKILVEKLWGCDHISCSCGAHWCWNCKKICSASTIYKHIAKNHGDYYYYD